MNQATTHLSQQELESYLWGAANLLRGFFLEVADTPFPSLPQRHTSTVVTERA